MEWIRDEGIPKLKQQFSQQTATREEILNHLGAGLCRYSRNVGQWYDVASDENDRKGAAVSVSLWAAIYSLPPGTVVNLKDTAALMQLIEEKFNEISKGSGNLTWDGVQQHFNHTCAVRAAPTPQETNPEQASGPPTPITPPQETNPGTPAASAKPATKPVAAPSEAKPPNPKLVTPVQQVKAPPKETPSAIAPTPSAAPAPKEETAAPVAPAPEPAESPVSPVPTAEPAKSEEAASPSASASPASAASMRPIYSQLEIIDLLISEYGLTLKNGVLTGAAAIAIQQKLHDAGYDLGGRGVDGQLGNDSLSALMQFIQKSGETPHAAINTLLGKVAEAPSASPQAPAAAPFAAEIEGAPEYGFTANVPRVPGAVQPAIG